VRYLLVLLVGVALGGATFALGASQGERAQNRPYCVGQVPADIATACWVVRNWCPWITRYAKPASQPEDGQVVSLLQDLRRTCPRGWRR
jgi:hypothetical protein